jgi:hypothetical protein
MSAAKIPSIRARMRQQDILTFRLTGPGQSSRRVRPAARHATPGLWQRTGMAVRNLADAIAAGRVHRSTPSIMH